MAEGFEREARVQRERAEQAEAEVARLLEEIMLMGRALASSSNGATIVDMRLPDHPIVFASDAFLRLSGYSREEVVGRNCRFLQRDDREQPELDEVRAALAEGRETRVSLRNYRKDGQMFWNELVLTPVRGESGEVEHFVGIQNDVSDFKLSQDHIQRMYKLLEDRVDERTRELVELNRQMESFTYSISHDLRAPLRAILSTAQILEEDFGDQLAGDARELLASQVKNARRLGGLIEDLLRLSRLSRSQMHKTATDLSAMAVRLAQEVGPGDVETEIEPEMIAMADPTLLEIILANLMENAYKFHRPGERPRVRVGRATEGTDRAFFVADSGIGISPEYLERIFQPFERLNAERDFPGSGIGLANVRLAVQRHGGRVWAESDPTGGVRFLFTLGPDQMLHDGPLEGAGR